MKIDAKNVRHSAFMRKENQTEKSNSFCTLKILFVSNENECPVNKCKGVIYHANKKRRRTFKWLI